MKWINVLMLIWFVVLLGVDLQHHDYLWSAINAGMIIWCGIDAYRDFKPKKNVDKTE